MSLCSLVSTDVISKLKDYTNDFKHTQIPAEKILLKELYPNVPEIKELYQLICVPDTTSAVKISESIFDELSNMFDYKKHKKNVVAFKMQSLVVGAMIMGIGGALYAHYSAAIQPGAFDALFGTFIIWTMLTLGGTGNNKGAIIGAWIVWAIWSWSTFIIMKVIPVSFSTRAPFIRYVLIGLLLVIIVVKYPKGIMGEERQVSKFSN